MIVAAVWLRAGRSGGEKEAPHELASILRLLQWPLFSQRKGEALLSLGSSPAHRLSERATTKRTTNFLGRKLSLALS